MAEACPIPTPAERAYGEVLSAAERAVMDTMVAALEAAQAKVADAFGTSGLEGQPPGFKYFAARTHQALFCILCDADPTTFAGGDANAAAKVIKNSRDIAQHHWGAGPE